MPVSDRRVMYPCLTLNRSHATLDEGAEGRSYHSCIRSKSLIAHSFDTQSRPALTYTRWI